MQIDKRILEAIAELRQLRDRVEGVERTLTIALLETQPPEGAFVALSAAEIQSDRLPGIFEDGIRSIDQAKGHV